MGAHWGSFPVIGEVPVVSITHCFALGMSVVDGLKSDYSVVSIVALSFVSFMMSSNVRRFVENPSFDYFEKRRKDDLLALAEHFQISVSRQCLSLPITLTPHVLALVLSLQPHSSHEYYVMAAGLTGTNYGKLMKANL